MGLSMKQYTAQRKKLEHARDLYQRRADQAEARVVELEAALKEEMAWDMGGVPENEWKARAEAAEVRVARLEEALRESVPLSEFERKTLHSMAAGTFPHKQLGKDPAVLRLLEKLSVAGVSVEPQE